MKEIYVDFDSEETIIYTEDLSNCRIKKDVLVNYTVGNVVDNVIKRVLEHRGEISIVKIDAVGLGVLITDILNKKLLEYDILGVDVLEYKIQ